MEYRILRYHTSPIMNLVEIDASVGFQVEAQTKGKCNANISNQNCEEDEHLYIYIYSNRVSYIEQPLEKQDRAMD